MGQRQQRSDGEVIAESLTTPAVFETVFDRHFATVMRYAAGRIGSDAAGDVAAEVFVRAFDRRHRFDPTRSATALPWLFGITANVCREYQRRLSRGRKASLRAGGDRAIGDAGFEGEVAERLDAESRRGELTAALDALTDDEYAVLTLAAIGDLSYQEIADRLGIPLGTVRSRLARARRRVRELLEPDRSIHVVEESPGNVNVEPTF